MTRSQIQNIQNNLEYELTIAINGNIAQKYWVLRAWGTGIRLTLPIPVGR